MSTRSRGIDQEEEIFMGTGRKTARVFRIPVQYEETFILIQLLGVIRKIIQLEDNFDTIRIQVSNFEKKLIGNLLTDKSTILNIKLENDNDVKNLSKAFIQDTIKLSKMFVRREKPPVEM